MNNIEPDPNQSYVEPLMVRRLSTQMGRAFGPALFFAALALLAYFTQGGHFAVAWGALVCLGVIYIYEPRTTAPFDFTTIIAIAFSAWLLFNLLVVSPNYQPQALYYPLLFLGGLWTFRRIDTAALPGYFAAGIVLLVLFALHGIVQVYFHWGYLTPEWPRATSIICIPNSFATLINLGLLPLVALYLLRTPSRSTLALIALLFAALLLSQSKGGLMGLGAGLVFMGFAMRSAGKFEKPLPWRLLLVTLIVVTGLTQVGNHLIGASDVARRMVDWRIAERGGRLYIYQIAWHLIEAHPWSGIGYYNFQYFFLRDKYPHFVHDLAYFVHDDYLQIWLESGIVGLLLLLALIGSFYRTVGKALRNPALLDRTTLIAIGAACTSVFAHALVDYPLYTHVIMLLLGAYIGAALRIAGGSDAAAAADSDKRLIRFMVTLIVLWLPAQKVIAEFYADQGLREMKQNHLAAAVQDYTLARRFTPREPYGYFAEGIVWYDAAITTRKQAAAVEADKLFAAGAKVNPYEFHNLMQRLILNRDYPQLLPAPADNSTLLKWARLIYHWRPTDPSVSFQYAKTLAHAGLQPQAAAHIDDYLAKNLIDQATAERWKQLLNLQ